MTTNRAGAICLLEILKEYSYADHILRMPDITSKLQNVYGITADRRSVYSAVELLRELGYDISDYSQNGEGYFLRGAEFDPSEVKNNPYKQQKGSAAGTSFFRFYFAFNSI